jgi:hypothetical protein
VYRWDSVESGYDIVNIYMYPYVGVGSWGEQIYWPLEVIDRMARRETWKDTPRPEELEKIRQVGYGDRVTE